ncbi:MAG: hypothetical protein IT560_13285 [Alphaproteobacteria bacterium]|nr:hypothetical protein [Alphaproteobacteria bacterium]
MADGTAQDGEKGFTGYRYLLDVADSRQFALRYEDGAPRPPIDVFAVMPKEKGFRANEVVFALDDEFRVTTRKDGSLAVETTAYQFLTDDKGVVRRLTLTPVDFDVTLDTSAPVAVAVLTLSGDARATMAEESFAQGFPRRFTYPLEDEQVTRTAAGASVDASVVQSFALPPHQKGGAFLARVGVHQSVGAAIARELLPAREAPLKPAAPAPAQKVTGGFSSPDAQTLVEKKDLGDGDTLKIVFNFESRRVTESVLSARGVALTSHKFRDYDETALEAAFQQLQKLGGSPRPLEGVKKPATLKTPKTP